jgi:hypothetical protein
MHAPRTGRRADIAGMKVLSRSGGAAAAAWVAATIVPPLKEAAQAAAEVEPWAVPERPPRVPPAAVT